MVTSTTGLLNTMSEPTEDFPDFGLDLRHRARIDLRAIERHVTPASGEGQEADVILVLVYLTSSSRIELDRNCMSSIQNSLAYPNIPERNDCAIAKMFSYDNKPASNLIEVEQVITTTQSGPSGSLPMTTEQREKVYLFPARGSDLVANPSWTDSSAAPPGRGRLHPLGLGQSDTIGTHGVSLRTSLRFHRG
jgi:hypothetical protein